jgi:hypothetical protein
MTRLRLLRVLPLARAAMALIAAEICGLASLRPECERFVTPLSLAGIVLGAAGVALFAGWYEKDERSFRIALDRLFGTEELLSLGTTWERWPRPRRRPRPEVLDQPRGSDFWMKTLAERYARLARLEAVAAPASILERERELIQKAIAELSPADALAVMRVWPELASPRLLKRGSSSTPGESN